MRRVTLLVAVGLLASALPARAATPSPVFAQRVAVPLYVNPSDTPAGGPADWDRVRDLEAPGFAFVVATGLVGPGITNPDPNYTTRVPELQAAGKTVLGYVDTSYATRDPAVVAAEIDQVFAWYGVDGVFFDQTGDPGDPAGCVTQPYTQALYDQVKTIGADAPVVMNPGVPVPECFLASADVLVNAETSFDSYALGFPARGYEATTSPSRFWHIVHGADSLEDQRRVMALARQRHAGLVYVTDRGLPDPPYLGLPEGTPDAFDAQLSWASFAPPIGAVDAWRATPGGLRFVGWVFDPDTKGTARVRSQVDGVAGTMTSAGLDRPDALSAWPGYGTKHGFSRVVKLTAGAHQVCVLGVNNRPDPAAAPGVTDTPLACTDHTYSADPFGVVDGFVRQGTALSVSGWAIDPDSKGTIRALVTVDGGKAKSLSANLTRGDIPGTWLDWGPKHGYSATLTVADGPHRVCATFSNTGPGVVSTPTCADVA